jgi:hypothetical protein
VFNVERVLSIDFLDYLNPQVVIIILGIIEVLFILGDTEPVHIQKEVFVYGLCLNRHFHLKICASHMSTKVAGKKSLQCILLSSMLFIID